MIYQFHSSLTVKCNFCWNYPWLGCLADMRSRGSIDIDKSRSVICALVCEKGIKKEGAEINAERCFISLSWEVSRHIRRRCCSYDSWESHLQLPATAIGTHTERGFIHTKGRGDGGGEIRCIKIEPVFASLCTQGERPAVSMIYIFLSLFDSFWLFPCQVFSLLCRL